MSRSPVPLAASASFAPRACNARLRSGVINRRQASISSGSVASRIRGDGEIHFGVAPEILIIALGEQVARDRW